jgi:hypothetical protein
MKKAGRIASLAAAGIGLVTSLPSFAEHLGEHQLATRATDASMASSLALANAPDRCANSIEIQKIKDGLDPDFYTWLCKMTSTNERLFPEPRDNQLRIGNMRDYESRLAALQGMTGALLRANMLGTQDNGYRIIASNIMRDPSNTLANPHDFTYSNITHERASRTCDIGNSDQYLQRFRDVAKGACYLTDQPKTVYIPTLADEISEVLKQRDNAFFVQEEEK